MNTIHKCAFLLVLLIVSSVNVIAQIKFEGNGAFEMELSKGGEKSHFFYNGIHAKHKDWRISPSEANLLGTVLFNDQWSLNGRVVLNRKEGTSFRNFQVALLNLLWVSKDKKYEITFGRFINPFGSFNHNQLPKDRTFIDLPLAYSFYTNISDKVGYLQHQQWNTILVDNELDWGSSTLYYGGYSEGIKFLWNINPEHSLLEISIVNGANLNRSFNSDPLNLGISGRYSFRPSSLIENGISISTGNFLKAHPLNASLSSLSRFTQTMIGTDFKYGQGFFEINGELIGSFYNTSFINSDDNINIVSVKEKKLLSSFSGYLDFRFEPPFLTGSYIAYRIDGMFFGRDNDLPWDENVNRHSFGFGYKITSFLLLRSSYSFQFVKNHDWDQTAFRTGLTAHF